MTGPFEIDELLKLKGQGRITRVHELSQDRIDWIPAFEVPELFQAYVELPSGRDSSSNSLRLQGEPSDAKSGTEWYYVENGDRVGPVTLAKLRELVKGGIVDSNTLVWCDDLSDWSAAMDVPQLAMEFPQRSTGRKISNPEDEKTVVAASDVACNSCGSRLHPTAKQCPTCGASRRGRKRGHYFLVSMIGLAVIASVAFAALLVWRQTQS